MIENDISAILDAPVAGANAPTLAHIEELLTAGYGRAMEIEADQWRLQRRIAEVAMKLADEHSDLRTAELKKLARRLKQAEADLVHIRALLTSLRARANDTRAA
jgi:ABC-type phosphate transport system auxiliary subunit